MLFYSFQFLFLFLPVVLGLYFYFCVRHGRRAAIVFLVLSSLFFYGCWSAWLVPLLSASIVCNYFFGRFLQTHQSKILLWAGVLANLGLLGYFKYSNFFIDIVNAAAHTQLHHLDVILPLGISFFTFQQISWLVDSYAREVDTRAEGFWRYALFISFFPHLIAGPLVVHSEMMPQFARDSTFRPKWSSLAIGLSIFIIGLAKKVILADEFGYTSTRIFMSAADGMVPCATAWLAAFCYSFQVYFDFSGYSDMAVGLARMFNIRLPMNFNSPFKAPSTIELWKRWHMTMTRFFQTHVHTPLSITLLRLQMRCKISGNLAIYVSTFVTLLAIGLWHGANWTYVIFGALQGVAIVFCHLWRAFAKKAGLRPLPAALGVALTYVFFTLTCVIYRAENLEVAGNMYRSMFMPHVLITAQFNFAKIALWLGGAAICFFMPNTQQIMRHYYPVLDNQNIIRLLRENFLYRARWRPSTVSCVAVLTLYFFCLDALLDANRVKEFIYFQF